MAKVYDVVVVVGEKDDGKPVWKNCGAVFQTDKGFAMKLDLVPIGGDGWFKFFDPQKKQEPKQTQSPPKDNDLDGDIPF